MPLKSSQIRVRTKRVNIKTPKGFSLEDTTVIRKKKSTLVGFTFTKVLPSKPPKPTKSQKTRRKGRISSVLGKKFPSGKPIPKRLQKRFKKQIKKIRRTR